ncbi:centromere protein H [Phasianus colchicus]|uniref:Centromere protein H n=1 Tax=Phasianus colchicus TaxID=9054 RepID=A0A669QGA1_PHACC|nr:centromere protein H [Phasianus colchicus]
MAGRRPESVAAGSGAEAEEAADPNVKRDVLEHLCVRTHLKQLVMEFSTACPRSTPPPGFAPPPSEDEECSSGMEFNFIESAKESMEEVEKVKIAFESKALALQRIQVMDALRKKVKQNDGCTRLIMETMKNIIELNCEIFQAHQQARVIRENLNDVRRKRYFLKQAEEGKVLLIFTTMRKKKEVARMKMAEKLKLLHRNVQYERKVITLIQNILQNIIVGCQISWAKDPSLKAIILQLEKDISIQNLL